MKTLLDLCEERPITIRRGVPGSWWTEERPAWVYGELAVLEHVSSAEPGAYGITHLPTGLSMGFDFDVLEHAIDAMIEIHALRNDWRHCEISEIRKLRDQIYEIVKQKGGGRQRRGAYEPSPSMNYNAGTGGNL